MFLGAFNDNVFKNALLVFVMFSFTDIFGMNVAAVVSLAAGLFILPFMLFSGIAGQLADGRNKAQLTRTIKAIEVALCIGMVIGFYIKSVPVLLAVLFAMGAQSTFFGPIKYSILPEYLDNNELLQGNGLIAGGTFMAILLGTIYGGFCILLPNGLYWVGCMLIVCAVFGLISSYYMGDTSVTHQETRLSLYKSSTYVLSYVWRTPKLWWLCMGISWFWFLGATFLSQFPAYIKFINGPPEWVSVLMAVFSVGVAIGSTVCNKLLKGTVSPRFLSLSSLGISLSTVHLVFVTRVIESNAYWMLTDVFLIAVFGGIFSVPLYTLLQAESSRTHGAQNIAANNILNAVFMVGSAIYAMVMFGVGLSVTDVFIGIALVSVPVGILLQSRLTR